MVQTAPPQNEEKERNPNRTYGSIWVSFGAGRGTRFSPRTARLGLPRSKQSTGLFLCTDSPSSPSQLKEKDRSDMHPTAFARLKLKEGLSPKAKIFRLAAYEQARRVLRRKCEPLSLLCELRNEALSPLFLRKEKRGLAPLFLFGAGRGTRTPVAFGLTVFKTAPL